MTDVHSRALKTKLGMTKKPAVKMPTKKPAMKVAVVVKKNPLKKGY